MTKKQAANGAVEEAVANSNSQIMPPEIRIRNPRSSQLESYRERRVYGVLESCVSVTSPAVGAFAYTKVTIACSPNGTHFFETHAWQDEME